MTSSPTDPGIGLVAEADLSVRAGNAVGHLHGSGSRLEFVCDDLAAFLASTPDGVGRVAFGRTAAMLGLGGLTLSVAERDRTVIEIGGRPSFLGHLAGIHGLRIRRPFRLLSTVVLKK